MNVSAIIAEYNPFTNGHKRHIEETKKLTGGSFIMVILSGNFVQRGESAILGKRERTKAALLEGADLVVELPVIWSLSSAERFAKGAVYIANQTGAVDNLSFGAEDDVETLKKIAKVLNDKVYNSRIKEYYDGNICPYTEARVRVASDVLKEDLSAVMSKPNNILAIEYLRALYFFKSDVSPLAIKRKGAYHNGSERTGGYASSLEIRKMINRNENFEKFVPRQSLEIIKKAKSEGSFPSDFKKLETAILSDLRRASPKDFINTPDVTEGLEYRILDASKTSLTLDEIIEKSITRRVTRARVRRVILYRFLGITKDDIDALPPYIRVLGLNENGRTILKEMKQKFFFPVVMKYGDVKNLGSKALRVFNIESVSTDLYNLTLPKRGVCGKEMTDEIVTVGI